MAHVSGTFSYVLVFECLTYMGYPILRDIPQEYALVVLDDSSRRVVLPLRNVLYNNNVLFFHNVSGF